MKLMKPLVSFFNSLKNQSVFISRKIILPGFEGIPLYEVVVFFFNGIRQSSLISRANALSFTFLLALFPAILFFFTLIPYIPIANLQETIMNTIHSALPANVYATVEETINNIVNHHHGGLLSLGFFVALYFSTSGMMGIMKAFNRTSHTIETRSNFKLRLISIFLVFIITMIVIIAASLLISTDYLIKYMESASILQGFVTRFLILAGKWVVLLIIIFSAISILYYFGPSSKKFYRFISAGSTFATLLSLIFILGFNYYIENFGQYNKLYGSIGTLIILMLWINLNAIVLLIGFELNASIQDAKIVKKNA